jgi:hypothetical protein
LAVALPEGGHIGIGHDAASVKVIYPCLDYPPFLVTHAIDGIASSGNLLKHLGHIGLAFSRKAFDFLNARSRGLLMQ